MPNVFHVTNLIFFYLGYSFIFKVIVIVVVIQTISGEKGVKMQSM